MLPSSPWLFKVNATCLYSLSELSCTQLGGNVINTWHPKKLLNVHFDNKLKFETNKMEIKLGN